MNKHDLALDVISAPQLAMINLTFDRFSRLPGYQFINGLIDLPIQALVFSLEVEKEKEA